MVGCCRDCSMVLYGEDVEDFSGMISRTIVNEGYALLVQCESCGPLLVDGDGLRIEAALCDA